MVSRARVIQNSMFLKEGFIMVSVCEGIQPAEMDLSINTALSLRSLRSDDYHSYERMGCVRCYVTSPIGGGKGYGMFHLPQVNSYGIVTSLEGSMNAYVWLGTLYKNIGGNINLPEENGITNNNITDNEDKIENLENALVITTKRTFLPKPLEPDDKDNKLDWEKRPVENVFVLDNKKVYIARNILDGDDRNIGLLELRMDDNGIEMNYNKDEQSGTVKVVIDKETKLPKISVSAMDTKNERRVSIEGNSNELMILADNAKSSKSTSILLNSNGGDQGAIITTSTDDKRATVVVKPNAIDLTADSISLTVNASNGGKVLLGNGTLPVAVYTGGPDELAVQPSDVVFA